ncbi:MAG: ribosome biogenesis GTP-binding protein YihA/YsxC [Leptonema sp. (in: bacteria)]
MLEYFPDVKFYKSFSNFKEIEEEKKSLKEIAICGRSNSGKSSLINVLCNQKQLAYVSSFAGKTKTINYYFVPSYKSYYKNFFLVDLPGFGFAEVSKEKKNQMIQLLDEYLEKSKKLALLILIVDAKRKLEEEEKSILAYCKDFNKDFLIVKSKWDRFNQKEKNQILKEWKENEELFNKTIFVSSLKKYNIKILISQIIEYVK